MKKLLLFIIVLFSTFINAQVLNEGFEGTTFPPTGWVTFDNGVGSNLWIRNTTASLVCQGVGSARINPQTFPVGQTSIDYLVTPQVTVPPNGQVRFYAKDSQSGNFGSIYTVRVSTASQTNPADFTIIQTYTETDFDYQNCIQKFIPLNAYVGQNIYIAFVMENNAGDRWLIDNVKVDEQCLAPTGLNVTPFSTTAQLSWTSTFPGGPWEVEYGPQGFTPGTGTFVTVNTNPNTTISGLSPLTSYSFYVRTLCEPDNVSPWSVVRNFTTTVAPPICGGNFVDPGGATGQYANNYNNTATPVVICPTNPGELVTVTFTSFNTETNWDALYVYDGPNTSSPLISSGNPAGNVPGGLAGGYWGTTIPGPFTSTHPSGCLTFVFISDSFGTRDGWTSNITCAPAPDYCAGDHFYDIGGATGNYPNSISPTRGYKKICPPAGQSVSVFFNSFNIADDTFSIYDGDDLATALLVGTYTGTSIIPSYTASNPAGNGCLIFVFTSNANTNAAGWDASIVCGPPCQSISSSIVGSSPPRGADTVIRVCQNQSFTIDGAAVFGNDGTGATYHWDFGDGNTAIGQSVSHSYSAPGIYSVSLYTKDAVGCRSVNRINQLVYVSTTPSFTGTLAADEEICLGQSTIITGAVTPQQYVRNCAPPVSGTTFLPDGSGVSYETSVPVDCFPLGTTLTSASQITSVCINMEHSFLGDLQLQLISPSGQSIILKAFPGGGGTYLGCPLDDPATTSGIGRDYCFTPTATTLLVNGATSNCGTPNGASINAGNYQPVQPFTNLIGSTLNGNWTLRVTDNLNIDNGYIFSWGINFDSALIPTDYQFTPVVTSSNWSPDPSITNVSGNQITVTPTSVGTHCYTYNVTDDFGCQYSQQVCIDVKPGVNLDSLTAGPTTCEGGDGVFNFVGTPNAIVTYDVTGGLNLTNQTIQLNASGTAVLTLPGISSTTTVTATYVTEPPVPLTGNAISVAGGANPNNATGPILPAGSAASVVNSTTINGTAANQNIILTLGHVIPAGTPVTISIARNNSTASVNIVDGATTQNFNTGALNILQHITFIKGTTSNTIRINRVNGTTYLDGVSYVFNQQGCDRNLNISATQIANAIPVIAVTPATCTSDGVATITNYAASNTYVFDPIGPTLNSSGVISNMIYGQSYTVVSTSSVCPNGNSLPFSIDEMLPTPATPVVDVTAPTCFADGFSTITNYDPTLTYTFNPVGPTIDPSGLIQSMVLGTSYTVTSTNSSLCTSIVSSAFVNQPMLITPVAPIVNVTAPTCTSDGVATITNYVAGETYDFNPTGPTVDASGVISNLTFGTSYVVTAFNGSCTSVASNAFTVSEMLPTPATPIVDVTAPTCFADGFSTITNYDPTLTYTFNPVGPTIDASGLIQSMVLGTSYTVTSTNSSLCTSIVSSAFVNQPMLITPVAPIVNVTAPTCTSDGVATITNYVAGETYDFNPTGPTVDASGVISNLTFGTSYVVTAFNGSCTSVASNAFTVSEMLPTPATPIVDVTAPTCFADGFSTITNYDPTLTYTFNPVGPTIDASGLIQSMVLGTSYTVTSTNSSLCTSIVSSAFVNQPMLITPVAPIVNVTAPTCTSDGVATITNYVAGETYDFNPTGPTVDASGVISNLTFGTSYVVTAFNGSCTSVASNAFTVSEMLPTPATPIVDVTAPTCFADGFSTITNYDPTLTYTFNPVGPTIDASGLIQSMVLGTSYTVTSTNSSLCTSIVSSAFVNQPMLITPVAPIVNVTAPTCTSDGVATITNYVAGETYDFNPTGPTVDASGVISNLTFGTSYVVTAFNGSCTSVASNAFTVSEMLPTPATPIVDVTAPTCFADGFSTITNYDPTLTYTFNPVGPTIDASGLIQSMVLGTSYTVTSTNSSLCTSIVSSAFVNQPMLITPVAPIVNVTAPTCTSDGVATITNYVAGETYDFNPTGPTVDASGVISNLTFGTSYVVTAFNGSCTSVASNAFTVSEILPKPVLVSIISNNSVCEGTAGSITITATPNSVVTYNIDGGLNQTVNIDATGSATIVTPILFINSTYNVVYVQSLIAPFCGQAQSGSATVVVKPLPNVIITPALTTICSGTSTSISLTSSVPGTTFSWVVSDQSNATGAFDSNGDFISQVLTATSATNSYVEYLVTPTADGCVGIPQSIRINISPSPEVVATNFNPVFCSGGSTNIQLASNVPGAVFSWTVTGGNVLGASGSTGTSINQTLTVNPGTTSTVEVVYSIVAEANGCLGPVQIVKVYVNPIPDVSIASSTVPLCSGETTNISISGTVPGTIFNWIVTSSTGVTGASNGAETSIQQMLTATSLSQGSVTYQVTPTFNGCIGTPQSVTVIVNPRPEMFATPTHRELCSNESTYITASTFNTNTIFDWVVFPVGVSGASSGSFSGTNLIISQLLHTTGNTQGYVDYVITPRLDSCKGNSMTVRVYVNPLPEPKLVDGSICVDASGVPFQTYTLNSGLDNATYDFVWYFNGNPIPNSNNATYTATAVGTYGVIATNSVTNCPSSDESDMVTAIVGSTTPATGISVTQTGYFSGNATITVDVTGGSGTLMYSLDEGTLQSSNIFTNVSSGPHVVTVIDTEGCTYFTYDVFIIGYPQYFTPNGDGYNDVWKIDGLQSTDVIFIFDRYGKLIKQLRGEEFWDGSYNQELLPSTDYWFTVDYYENGAKKQFKAHFALKR